MKFDVLNRFTGKVQFTAEIDCASEAAIPVKIGLAVRWAFRTGAYLSDANLSDADLSGADLSGADLSGAYLSGADLSGADLSDAYLSDANLRDADLSGADLSGANLRDADLSGAYLSDANLRDAYLSGADLSDADLSGADLSGAYLSGADLGDQWIIQGSTRADGYAFFLVNLKAEGVRVKGGCHNFSIVEAERHWKETLGDTPLGRETALIIAGMIEQAKARGYSFEPVEALSNGESDG